MTDGGSKLGIDATNNFADEGHKLGGYQCWTGFHSYAEPGTGERIFDEAVAILKGLNK